MVFYLKYRPQKIKELDSISLQEKLTAILSGRLPVASQKKPKKDTIAHAFLFTGPKGLGKTSTARIIAKAVNCTNRKSEKDIEPCDRCSSCLSITNGSNLDVIEIDAASNRGIDEIRDLREKIRLSPVSSFKKVYIIDEVHMLTTEAFNALLKTLEEPPFHALFILCTTDPQKVPATIASRCFHIAFEKATEEDMLRSFQRIVKGERMSIDKDALSLIASLSDASFRDGAKNLEELSLLAGNKKITKEFVEKKLNIANISANLELFMEAFISKNTKEALSVIQKLADQGIDFKFFIEELIEDIHGKLLSKVDKGEEVGNLKDAISLLVRSHQEQKYSILPQLPLELAVIDFSEESERPVQAMFDAKVVKTTSSPSSKNDKILEELIAKVKESNYSVAGVLRGCRIEEAGSGKIIIMTTYKFHKDRLSEEKITALVEKSAEEVLGEKVKLSVRLGSA
ncbi:MAG: DNA polymerase III subunit gamma/tau [Candidatus Levybacteria bacterium]|nr:DNA polymerase III subunit gamma/tau [Candidatus Levybacteria bacterium]MBI2420792.1 DNA polymerase III subunit gamma/tau [Candidatus Levybacteria bacterium]